MNNSKIVLSTTKTTSAIFLAIVLVTGTITALSSSSTSSFMVGVEAQTYYEGDGGGMNNRYNSYESTDYTDKNSYEPTVKDYEIDDNSYPKTYGKDNGYGQSQYQSYGKDNRDKSKDSSKSVSINKLKCINTNININGNNTGDVNIGNKGAAADGGYVGGGYSSNNGGYDGGEGYYDNGYDNKRDKGFDCIINNNNINFETISPEPSKASLKVIKNVTCTYLEPGQLNPQLACGRLVEEITEDQFLIEVTNDNPVPSQFNGSESGTIVTLGAGNYIVSETRDASVEEDIEDLEKEFFDETNINYEIDGPITTFTGDCIPVNADSEATGTIRAGESQTCEIENHFEIGAVTSAFTIGSSITTQETKDSSELTALAKITKLKQQWLDQIS